MGSKQSQLGLYDLRELWSIVPQNGEIVVTRDKITVSNSPSLEIKNRVVHYDYHPGTQSPATGGNRRQLMVSLSDLDYVQGEQYDFTPRSYSGVLHHPLQRNFIPASRYGSTAYSPHKYAKESPSAGEEVKVIRASHHPKVSSVVVLPTEETDEEVDEVYKTERESEHFLHERAPTTIFKTRSMDEGDRRELVALLAQHSGDMEAPIRHWDRQSYDNIKVPMKIEEKLQEHRRVGSKTSPELGERRNSNPMVTDKGVVLAKKLATKHEQKGKLECHVYFTPRTSAEIWPHLVVTVGEEWDFIKVIRKCLADMQRTIKRGDRCGTHDWIFDYHPNKELWKIKKDLKVLFGRRALTFRDSNLKKQIKEATNEFVNKMWIVTKDSAEEKKHSKRRSRVNRNNLDSSAKSRVRVKPSTIRNGAINFPRSYTTGDVRLFKRN